MLLNNFSFSTRVQFEILSHHLVKEREQNWDVEIKKKSRAGFNKSVRDLRKTGLNDVK